MSQIDASLTGIDLSSRISVAVAGKAMDAQRQEGDAALALLQAAAEVAEAAASQPPSGRLDTYA